MTVAREGTVSVDLDVYDDTYTDDYEPSAVTVQRAVAVEVEDRTVTVEEAS